MSDTLVAPELQAKYLELPLVAAQPGIWMADSIASRRNVFTVAHAIELNGPLDRDDLDMAIRQGLAEADTIHARFTLNEDGEPRQSVPTRVLPDAVRPVEWLDLSERPEGEAAAYALMQADLAEELPADGERLLYQHRVIRVSAAPERWLWYQRYHHLLLDGFSFDALTRRIVDIYNALRAGKAASPTPFTPFSDVVDEYLTWQSSPACQRAAEFWRTHAADLPTPISLSTEEGLPHADTVRTWHHSLSYPAAPFAALAASSELGQAQPAEIAMAALAVYLFRMSGEPRLSIGFPFMRRMGSAALSAVGPVVNVLPLQLTLSPDMTLTDVTRALLAEIKTVRRHQRYEAEQLRRDLGRVGEQDGLYGPVFNYKVYNAGVSLDGTPAVTHVLAMGPVDDLEFEIGVDGDRLQLGLVANPARYDRETLAAHGDRLQHLLSQLAEQPAQPIGELSLLSPEEQRRIDSWSRGPQLAMPDNCASVIDLLVRQATRQPNAVAVTSANEQIDYATLSARVMQLARVLIARGVSADDVVAIAVPRSVDSVVAILAVLASGAAYLPLDLDYPRERLTLMCEDARPVLLLTWRDRLAQMPELADALCLDDDALRAECQAASAAPIGDGERPQPLSGDHLAYIIYTSGSTGRPKGVMSTHRGLLNLLLSHQHFLFGPAMTRFQQRHERRLRAGHTASFSFDSSWEPLFCMLMGSELYIFDEDLRRDAWALVQQMNQVPVDLLDITPSFFSQLIDAGLLEAEQHQPAFIMIGGEAATPRLWQLMQRQNAIEIHNYYGPSEYTIDTLGASVQAADQPVIGRPVANTRVWLLDARLQPVPVGVPGELYISGPGIARGYLRRPDLTAARFVANPFAPGEVMYRTGDVLRWRPDGQLAFIGRVDHQIKVRGFRVELGEIESALAGLPEVSTAVVIAEPMGATHRLIGYCSVPDEALRAQPDISARLLAQLGVSLPEYMVPALLMVMAELPLTVNGKIDRQALPKPQSAAVRQGRAAQGEQEVLICEAIATLLRMDAVNADDDFFALGGDSISAMGLATALRRQGWLLRPREIFSERTPAGMARAMCPLTQQAQLPRVVQRGPLTGLPILHWFARHHGINRRFAHGVWLNVPEEMDAAHTALALAALIASHPVLAAYTQDERLVVGEPPRHAAASLCRTLAVEGDAEAAAEQAFDEAVGRLDPAQGVMLQAVLLRRNEAQSCGLVLVIHHLAVDGVSWRVLLPELRQAAEAVLAGQTATLPEEACSLHDWSSHLLADIPRRRDELAFWQSMLPPDVPRLGRRPLAEEQDRQSRQCEQRLLLNAQQTEALLTTLPLRYRAGVEETLLCTLALACARRFAVSRLRLTLESHGRSDQDDRIDLTRTLGWLTAEYPVCLDWSDADAAQPWQVMRAVKRVLRAVPDRGIGYGVLRYLDATNADSLSEREAQSAPDILFNYLGRFETADGAWAPQRSARRFRDAFAVVQDGQMALGHGLEINLFVDEGQGEPRLAIHWGWAEGVFNRDDIDALHQALAQAADALLTAALRQPRFAADTLVAADVGLAGVTDDTLAQISRRHGPLAAVLPLLPLQKGLLFHAQMAADSGSYNSLTRLSLRGPVTAERIGQALNAVVRHHPQLAARFDSEHAEQPLQLIPLLQDDADYWPLEVQTLPTMTPEQESDALLALEKAELARDLFHQPQTMLRALLVSHADGERHTLFLNAHHLIVDGWSTPVLLRDLFKVLENAALTPPRISYGDVVRQLTARDAERSRSLWREVLSDARPTLLFGDGPHDDEVRELALLPEPELERGLLTLCRQHGLTLNTLMQGVWGLLLSAYSGANDVIFGAPVSGRFGHIDGIDEHIGLFSNTLPVRVKLDPARSLLSQLGALQAQQIRLIEHDDLGLGDIQQLAGNGTLFDTLLVVENYPDSGALGSGSAGIRCEAMNNRGYTHYPLTLLVLPGERLRLLMEYRPSVPQPDRLARRLMQLLTQLVNQPEQPLCAWDLQLPEEQALLAKVNNTTHAVAPMTLHEALERQARQTPHGAALADAQHQLTYRQMRQQVDLLAERLMEAGVVPGDIVAVALPRSVRLSLALQAIVAVGAAWLPLDTGYPDERLALMMDDATPRLVITESALKARFASLGDTLLFDVLEDARRQPSRVAAAISPQHPAYVIYTSGSTGRPKGVVVSHQAIINRLWWMQDAYRLTHDDVVLQKTPCSFDVSVWEFFWPLMVGARLVMAPPDAHRDPDALTQLINDYAVTTLHFVPSMLAAWIGALDAQTDIGCGSLRRVFCSGEALSQELAESYQTRVAAPLHNLYGPTEAAVDVTYQPASGEALAHCTTGGVPIGLPVWNTQLRILDSALRPVPLGVAGDLYLCGIQLAQGYLRRPDLTAGRFVADPFADGARMYRTGDIARWREDGAVDYLGRSDDQLKIRGQRIELGEIEQALLAQPDVAQAVVCARELGERRGALTGADARQLVAWVIPQEGVTLELAALQQALAQALPAHMLPVSYVTMTHFPLSANGKLDRKALPSPTGQAQAGREPETEHERMLAALFAEILTLPTVYADDDFFALGGHSLLAMRLAAEIRRRLGRSLTVGQIMAARSVEQIAQRLVGEGEASRHSGADETLPLRAGSGPTLFCLHPASGFAWQYAGLLRHLTGNYPLVGLQSPRPDGVIAACDSVAAMCERHLATIRRIQPQGPYYLLGYSLGGTLAHGIAARLEAAGEQVAFLGLFDTYPPEGQDWSGPSEEQAQQEVAQEQAEFMAEAEEETDEHLRAEKAAMFRDIVANYRDAVQRLSTASTLRYHGEATLFVATGTLPEGMDVQATWAPYVDRLTTYLQPCEHADILSPASLERLGPQLNRLLMPLAERQSR
ncbi:amino acid adenylation domain-containing protein [Lonsdalea quercina]|uniref:amino acid adenylation domain-containing protein n=1 Tax=Lonsdalea quercina TaxID=71657 RepID=UPI0039750C87